MARALQIFALLSAFLVVALRSFGAFPAASAALAEGFSGKGVIEARSSSDAPVDQDVLTVADLDDDADDNADALVAPSPVRLVLLAGGEAERIAGGALVAARPLPSHAQSLDRPPRV